ncbi:MAG: DinB family protein [Acidimicrobiales bacterium]|nr:DinB family protein [Acidimicrobiales bacterium]
MKVHPRYDGPPILDIEGSPDEQREPLTRQRRRMQAMLAELDPADWSAPTRCADWPVRDVVAHLVGVNRFWNASIVAGAAGTPTRWLVGFDPAATPADMVASMADIDTAELLRQFDDSTDQLLATVASLDEPSWSMLAESPAGHVPIRLLAQHALWDSWIHERDIALPLGLEPEVCHDEVRACLQYATVIGPALALQSREATDTDVYVVEAVHPPLTFVLEVGPAVHLRDADDEERPCGSTTILRGDAVELIEVLSLRAPAPESTPEVWRSLLGGLAEAFDVP